jgi:hypothetical protein
LILILTIGSHSDFQKNNVYPFVRRNIKQYWSSIAPLATKWNSFRDRHKEQGECLLQAIYQLSVIVWFLVIHVIVTHVVSGHPCDRHACGLPTGNQK